MNTQTTAKGKEITSREQEIIFTNWTNSEFKGVWDKKLYNLESGKSYYLPFYLAEHFAKHHADREYYTAFNKKLAELKETIGSQVDRQTLEHRVRNSNEVFKLSIQDMIDKCVTVIPEQDKIDVVRPKEVKLKEVVLRRDERAEELREKYGDKIEVQANEKALRQAKEEDKEEFESAEDENKQN